MKTIEKKKDFGFFRVAAAVPELRVADVRYNVTEILRLAREISDKGAELIVFPELSITGYSCGDLFFQPHLLSASLDALGEIALQSRNFLSIIVVGFPIQFNSILYNSSAVIFRGKILGIVPKSYLPSTGEFYEARWFNSGLGIHGAEILLGSENIPFGTDLIFQDIELKNLAIGLEICEDLWAVNPPSCNSALAGATVLVNLSASNELLGKSDYRRKLVEQQSARCIAAYVYSSSGVGESSSDVVFSGHGMISENGRILDETGRFDFSSSYALADIDLQGLYSDRMKSASYRQTSSEKSFRSIGFSFPKNSDGVDSISLFRKIEKNPFVPSDLEKRTFHCKEIISIQSFGLAKRIKSSGIKKIVIGLSGGLDSTLALLVCTEACRIQGLPMENIFAFSLPGFGTTDRTRNNAKKLSELLKISFQTIPINESVALHFKDIGHNPDVFDSTYENSQARERTQILMDMANRLNGIVVGTGDLSEIALGWCTYNADQMSMYNVNCGVPKTLVRFLVEWFSEHKFSGEISEVLKDICDTPISPELLPSDGKVMTQKTEESIGPYELHDFFLYYFIRFQFSPAKILFLAEKAYSGVYDRKEILGWLSVFFQRFFQNQFKRSAMPDGPKVGSVALSQRGDWRMPSDVDASLWINEIKRFENL